MRKVQLFNPHGFHTAPGKYSRVTMPYDTTCSSQTSPSSRCQPEIYSQRSRYPTTWLERGNLLALSRHEVRQLLRLIRIQDRQLVAHVGVGAADLVDATIELELFGEDTQCRSTRLPCADDH